MPEIIFKYKWLWSGYTADVTFTKDMINPEAWKYLEKLGAKRSLVTGSYTKHYTGRTTYEIIKLIQADIVEANRLFKNKNYDEANAASVTAQKYARQVSTKSASEAERQDNKAVLAYLLTNFCGYQKATSITSLRKGTLQAQTRKTGRFGLGREKIIYPGRGAACEALDKAYNTNPQPKITKEEISELVVTPNDVPGGVDQKEIFDKMYDAGLENKWHTKGGMRQTRKNRK